MVELLFPLSADEGWPPVSKECLIFSKCSDGYRLEVPPFFIKDMSVGDIISVEEGEDGNVINWRHVEKSGRTTIWIKVSGEVSIEDILDRLRILKCNVERFTEFKYFSIDVAAECPISSVDDLIDSLNEEEVAVAFPSFRHDED